MKKVLCMLIIIAGLLYVFTEYGSAYKNGDKDFSSQNDTFVKNYAEDIDSFNEKWSCLCGYWVNAYGGYSFFNLNEAETPVYYCFNNSGVLTSFANVTNLTCDGDIYTLTLEYPNIDKTENVGSLGQSEKTAFLEINVSNLKSGYVVASFAGEGKFVYVYAGQTADELMENLESSQLTAKKFDDSLNLNSNT